MQLSRLCPRGEVEHLENLPTASTESQRRRMPRQRVVQGQGGLRRGLRPKPLRREPVTAAFQSSCWPIRAPERKLPKGATDAGLQYYELSRGRERPLAFLGHPCLEALLETPHAGLGVIRRLEQILQRRIRMQQKRDAPAGQGEQPVQARTLP